MLRSNRSKWIGAGLLAAGLAFSLTVGPNVAADDATPKASPTPKARPRVIVAPGARIDLGECRGRGFAASKRSFLGVEATPITPELRRHFGSPEGTGVLVSRVIEGGPAARAGIEVGDVLVRCAGEEVEEPRDLRSAIRERRGGEAVTVELIRGGKARQVSVKLEEKETCSFDVGEVLDFGDLESLRELGNLEELQGLEGLEGLEGLHIDLEGIDLNGLIGNAVGVAVESLDEILKNKDWQREIEVLHEGRAEELEQRMEEVARQLEQLEEKLQAETGRYSEKAKAEIERAREELRRDMNRRQEEIEREVRQQIEEARRDAEEVRRDAAKGTGSGGSGGGSEIL